MNNNIYNSISIKKMDRYVVREPRAEGEYLGNQMLAFSPSTSSNMIPENMYYGGYAAQFPLHRGDSSGFIGVPHVNAPPFAPANHVPGQGQAMSGIDRRYLAAYAENNAAFGSGQQPQIRREQNPVLMSSPMSNHEFGNDYQNRSFAGATHFKSTSVPQMIYGEGRQPTIYQKHEMPKTKPVLHDNVKMNDQKNRQEFQVTAKNVPQIPSPKQPAIKIDFQKTEVQNQAMTRFDRLKALNKSGPRAFSGPVEKVLKWHKALQDIGVLVLYEIVAKCVNVRPGESCAKNLVVRDDGGPAMQVVYYEIDFLLPELKPPCTIRVIGRMMPGTSRLQAFNVRLATGDDVATLPRRAAVTAHHVAKLCKEYGNNVI